MDDLTNYLRDELYPQGEDVDLGESRKRSYRNSIAAGLGALLISLPSASPAQDYSDVVAKKDDKRISMTRLHENTHKDFIETFTYALENKARDLYKSGLSPTDKGDLKRADNIAGKRIEKIKLSRGNILRGAYIVKYEDGTFIKLIYGGGPGDYQIDDIMFLHKDIEALKDFF